MLDVPNFFFKYYTPRQIYKEMILQFRNQKSDQRIHTYLITKKMAYLISESKMSQKHNFLFNYNFLRKAAFVAGDFHFSLLNKKCKTKFNVLFFCKFDAMIWHRWKFLLSFQCHHPILNWHLIFVNIIFQSMSSTQKWQIRDKSSQVGRGGRIGIMIYQPIFPGMSTRFSLWWNMIA